MKFVYVSLRKIPVILVATKSSFFKLAIFSKQNHQIRQTKWECMASIIDHVSL